LAIRAVFIVKVLFHILRRLVKRGTFALRSRLRFNRFMINIKRGTFALSGSVEVQEGNLRASRSVEVPVWGKAGKIRLRCKSLITLCVFRSRAYPTPFLRFARAG
jgi:hypothetical protein